jgi:predicted ATPase
MLHRLRVTGFKSLRDVDVELARLVVVFGPNAAGKSNLLESMVLLSRLVGERTLADAFDAGIRGYPTEAFSVDPLLGAEERRALALHAEIEGADDTFLEYRVAVSIRPQSGELGLEDELLARLTNGAPRKRKGNPAVERVDTEAGPRIRIRRKGRQSHPFEEPPGISHTLASNMQFAGEGRFPDFDALRGEVDAWRAVYLDPREAMRRSQPPREVEDIGERGEHLVPFLHRLRVNKAWEGHFRAIERGVRAVIPSIERIHTELVPARGEIDLFVEQDGLRMPARVVSEGTLRVLALCAMAASPFPTRLLAFEEPENGVHPRRIEVIARTLATASRRRQVVVTTHSPLVVSAVISMIRARELDAQHVKLLQCSGGAEGTRIRAFEPAGELFEDTELRKALLAADDDAVIQGALVRGWFDD